MSEKENLVAAKPISHSYESTGSTFVPTTVDNAEVQDKPGSSSSVSFHDISYEVSRWCGRKRKVILNSASGLLPCGLNAIMGPTGSGKTTLLDILAGRKRKSGLSGIVLVNGDRQPKNFKCISGYVVQDDVVMGTLSVRENLHFSAALRLPSHMTHAQRKERVERVIDELGLRSCASTKVGTEFLRGVSGGERKRTNIGMELIIEPQVLFLDEPTSGLDAYTAVSVVKLLKQLSRTADRIIIVSIHQPRYSIFKLFDTLTLLSVGNLVYHGPSRRTLEYFEEIGFQCEEHENPADFFLDIITRCENPPRAALENQGEDGDDVKVVDLLECYQQSEQHRTVQRQLQPLLDSLFGREQAGGTIRNKKKAIAYATNFFWQLLIVSIRSMVNYLRSPMASVIQVVVMVIFALLVGILYFRINDREVNPFNALNDNLGALFFVSLNMVFGNMSAIDLFIRKTNLFIHENSNGFYRVSAYFLALVLTDLIPMRIIPLCVFTVIVYFMVGFQLQVDKFFIFLLTLMLTSIAAASLIFAVGSRVKVAGAASLLASMLFVIQMLFGGFFVTFSSLPDWIRWMRYVSIIHYAVEALSINEIVGQCYCPTTNITIITNITNSTGLCFEDCINGTEQLLDRGFETSMDWLWYDQIALVGLSLLLLALTYINLRMVNKEK